MCMIISTKNTIVVLSLLALINFYWFLLAKCVLLLRRNIVQLNLLNKKPVTKQFYFITEN